MSGSTPHIDTIDFSSSQKEVIVNRVNNAEAPAALFGIKTLVGTTLVLYGGTLDVAGVPTVVANQSVTLTDAATNYVKADASGTVSVVTAAPSGWPGPLASSVTALYTIVMSGGVYTSITEWRVATKTAGAAGVSSVSSISASDAPVIIGRQAQSPQAGPLDELTPTEVTAMLDQFLGDSGSPTDPRKGLVPAPTPGDGTTKFLRSDGTWATPTAAVTKVVQFACSDLTTALTPGTDKAVFRMPYAMTVTAVRASLYVADTGSPVSGITIDINESGASILSTKLTIDAGEKTSTTAATPAVISDSALADDAEITVDIDACGGNSKGLVVTLIGT